MRIRKLLSGAIVSVAMMMGSAPARAGIPVIDGANLAQAIMEILAWAEQAQQMLDQINQMQQQYQQLQTMTARLEGARSLGTILNDPAIQGALPQNMRNASQLLLNPSAIGTDPANVRQILASFGVDTTNPAAGAAAADTIGRVQQILTAAQQRTGQLQQLAGRVNTTADAKDSMDMVNRNVLEAASINNQMMQTMAELEAARQSEALKRLADNQAYFARVRAAAAQPLRDLTY